ncbi:alpha/beta hydrolase [Streptomyces sp. NPDC006553]|uniref:alpha/beta hydrolase n=1 Tax=unclassified Streptomyces TaxID=2593676 RepID=UPI002258C2D3|nr:alpha/beta hydrolase [Streptomyces sp. NBC_00233]MCX5225601.1 alpha/beta hydrolase [Streptomyces sp. NBC_00233]
MTTTDARPADPLTPAARALCDAMSTAFPRPEEGAEALRAAVRAHLGEIPPTPTVSANGVPVRLYEGREDLVVVFAHGGGWVLCDLDTHDRTCRALATRTGATVVSVDYRRAPEHRYPAAEDDVCTALAWAADRYPGRPLVLAGDSSGGNLAAAAALRARDGGGPPPAGQLLVYPALDHRLEGRSARDFAEGYFHTTAHMRWYWQQYVAPGADPAAASPGLAPDVSGLPPTLIVLADCDPLRDEGLAYARRLSAAGVRTEVRLHTGTFHGFLGGTGVLPEADAALEGAAGWLRALRP